MPTRTSVHSGAVKMRWLVVAVVMLVAAVAVAVVYLHRQHDRGTPYTTPKPERNLVTLTARSGKVCTSSDGLPTPKLDKLAPRVWVDPDPVGGLVLWRPGMNSKPCKARFAHLSKPLAQAFAQAVEKAPLPPSGAVNCPMDDGSGATVFLTYQGKQNAEVVRVALAGCQSLSAPGRLARQVGAALAPLGRSPVGMH